MKQICPFIFLLLFIRASSQDLTGTWEGSCSAFGPRYAKLVIIKCGDQYIGYTYDSQPGFCQANFAGNFNESTLQLKGENKGMIRKTIEHSQAKYEFRYASNTGEEVLEGVVRPKTTGVKILSFGIGTKIYLKKVSPFVDTTEFMKACIEAGLATITDTTSLQDSVAITPAIETPKQNTVKESVTMAIATDSIKSGKNISIIRAERKNDTVSIIYTNELVINITLYDNGQVDGDSVTVFHNKHIIVERLGVTGTPYKFSINIDRQNPRHEIVLVAHNLGSIPPNTARLVIEAGGKKYNLSASSDLSKNSVIIFEFRE